MNWSKELPKETGYFWARRHGDQRTAEIITIMYLDSPNDLYVIDYAAGANIPLAAWAWDQETGVQPYEFFGPLEPPEGQTQPTRPALHAV